jgi:histidinol-phosphate aminotransferase
MTDFSKLVPEHLRRLPGYTPGKPVRQAEQECGVHCIKMASNENPFGPSPRAIAALQRTAADVNFYPDNDVSELTIRVGELHGVDPHQVVLTAGSTSLLDVLARTLLGPGLNAITSKLSFIVYPVATKATGAQFIEVPMRSHGYDLDTIAATVDKNTRLIYLANPNNPTGTVFDAATLDRFLDRLPDHVTVALDEAYCDFAQYLAKLQGFEYSHSIDYVRQQRNVVVLRTFSKAHGLAGLRVGYGLGPSELINYLARVRTTFSVSSAAQAAALAALEDKAHIQKTVKSNAEGAKFLTAGIKEMGFAVVPTAANFLYVELGEDAAAVFKRLEAEGVIVRPLTAWGAPDAIRVTIGTPEQNQVFLAAFKKVMEKATV